MKSLLKALTLFLVSSALSVPCGGGWSIGADEDLPPSSVAIGVGESCREVDGDGNASLEVAGL